MGGPLPDGGRFGSSGEPPCVSMRINESPRMSWTNSTTRLRGQLILLLASANFIPALEAPNARSRPLGGLIGLTRSFVDKPACTPARRQDCPPHIAFWYRTGGVGGHL